MYVERAGSQENDQLNIKRNSTSKSSIIQNHFQRFCQQTSLHGYQYLLQHGIVSTLLWSFIILCSTVTAIFLFVMNLSAYLNSRPMTTINDTTAPLHNLFFPGVHLCNINQVPKHLAWQCLKFLWFMWMSVLASSLRLLWVYNKQFKNRPASIVNILLCPFKLLHWQMGILDLCL